jgi:DNA helicase-2/ATP-dependent DNA helicase PcrA
VTSTSEAFQGNALRSFVNLALSRAEIEPKTSNFLTSSLMSLADRLDFRAFTNAAFQWFEEVSDILPDDDTSFLEYSEEKTTWQQLVAEIEEQFSADQVTLNVLLQELDMRSKAPQPPNGAIPCFTVHASKGLEFGRVYLMGMVEDQMPSWAAVKKGAQSREMQEERRMCFVAITRTEDTLTMTYARRVFGWNKSPSRFLTDMALLSE